MCNSLLPPAPIIKYPPPGSEGGWNFTPFLFVGWLWVTRHIRLGPRHGNSYLVPGDCQPPRGELIHLYPGALLGIEPGLPVQKTRCMRLHKLLPIPIHSFSLSSCATGRLIIRNMFGSAPGSFCHRNWVTSCSAGWRLIWKGFFPVSWHCDMMEPELPKNSSDVCSKVRPSQHLLINQCSAPLMCMLSREDDVSLHKISITSQICWQVMTSAEKLFNWGQIEGYILEEKIKYVLTAIEWFLLTIVIFYIIWVFPNLHPHQWGRQLISMYLPTGPRQKKILPPNFVYAFLYQFCTSQPKEISGGMISLP